MKLFIILVLFAAIATEASKCNTYQTIKDCDAAGCTWSHFGCLASPPAPILAMVPQETCTHQEDIEDHKCFEACASSSFKTKGIAVSGKCPTLYSTVDKTTTVQQCPDGFTNPRYCQAINVTITTKGEAGALMDMVEPLLVEAPVQHFHGLSGNQCKETTLPMAGVSTTGECPASYDIREAQETDTVCKTGGNLKYCKPENIVKVTVMTWGQSGWSHAIANNHCTEANFTLPGVNLTGLCPRKQYSTISSDTVTTVCRTGGNLKYCAPRDIIQVEVVTRGDKL